MLSSELSSGPVHRTPARSFLFVAAVVAACVTRTAAAGAAGSKEKPTGARLGARGQIVVSTAQTLPIAAYSHGDSGSLVYGDDLDEPVYSAPRLVVDYVVAPRFTIGSDVLASFTVGSDAKGGEKPAVTLFGAAPHVGYLLAPNALVAFWLRAGVTYSSLTEANAAISTTHRQLSLSLAAHLVITPFPHLGVTMGPAMDVPISGTLVLRDRAAGTSREAHASAFHVGFSAGLLVYF